MNEVRRNDPPDNKFRNRFVGFLERLQQESLINSEVAGECSRILKDSGLGALEYLLDLNLLSRDELGNRWAEHIGVAYVDPDQTIADPALARLLPEHFCKKHGCLPLYQFGEMITVAMTDPFNLALISEAETRLNKRISPVFSFPSNINKYLKLQELSSESLTDFIADLERKLAREAERLKGDQDGMLADLPSAVELVDTLLLWSKAERASDIHIEPSEKTTRVRFRIDGILEDRLRFDKRLHPPIVNRLKVLANTDISESRRPQDGNLKVRVREVPLEFRFSTVPSVRGERLVLRSTSESGQKAVENLDHLGFPQQTKETLRSIISSPNGLLFVTGPTGSGKSTTLAALIHELNKPGINIMTIEDPVERQIPGVSQTQPNKAIDLGFAPILRAFLRQDPDVILIGEIRDLETAKIAAEAALTGHLVLSTLHTNNALQAITRLIDIGVDPFLVAPSISGVMAQRLLRRLCDACKQPFHPTQEQLAPFFFNTEDVEVRLFQAKGCPACNHSGYKGRFAIHEVFAISDGMRSLISRNASLVEMERLAADEEFRPMKYEALKRVLRGDTSLEEVMRVMPS